MFPDSMAETDVEIQTTPKLIDDDEYNALGETTVRRKEVETQRHFVHHRHRNRHQTFE